MMEDKDKKWVQGPQVNRHNITDPFYTLPKVKYNDEGSLQEDESEETVMATRVQYWLDQAPSMLASYVSETITDETASYVSETQPTRPLDTLKLMKMKPEDLHDASEVLPKVIKCYNRIYYWINTGRPADDQIPYEIAQMDLSSVDSILRAESATLNNGTPVFLTEYIQKNLNRLWKKYALKDGIQLDKNVSSSVTIDGKYAI